MLPGPGVVKTWISYSSWRKPCASVICSAQNHKSVSVQMHFCIYTSSQLSASPCFILQGLHWLPELVLTVLRSHRGAACCQCRELMGAEVIKEDGMLCSSETAALHHFSKAKWECRSHPVTAASFWDTQCIKATLSFYVNS